MNLYQLMELFSTAESIHSLVLSDKLYASLVTTILGMGITFSALIILLLAISLMHKCIAPPATITQEKPVDATVEEDEAAVIAAITIAVAETMQTSRKNIIIRNIKRVNDFQPQWSRAGIRNQLNNSLNL